MIALVLERMLVAGVDVVRFNFSHGTAEDHLARAQLVRETSAKLGLDIAIMADLQGPKIRVGKFEGGKATLHAGKKFVLDASATLGTADRVGLDYKDLPSEVKSGDTLLLSDGLLVLDVERVAGSEIHTQVRIGGDLSNNKGINKLGGGLSAPALTGKDVRDIETAMQCGADYVAISFVKSGTDVEMARQLATDCRREARRQAADHREDRACRSDSANCARFWRPRTASWWRAAIWRSRWATQRCRRCKSA